MNRAIADFIADLWPQWKPTKAMLQLWSASLAQVPLERLVEAIALHAERSQFPPTLADMRALTAPQEADQSCALEEWGQLERYREWSQSLPDITHTDSDTAAEVREKAKPVVSSLAQEVAHLVMGPRWKYSETWAKDRVANRARFVELYQHQERREMLAADRTRVRKVLGHGAPAAIRELMAQCLPRVEVVE